MSVGVHRATFDSTIPRAARWTPEHKLLAALIESVELDLRKFRHANARLKHRHAIDWLLSADQRPFGFLWVCDHLHLSPQAVRAELFAKCAECSGAAAREEVLR